MTTNEALAVTVISGRTATCTACPWTSHLNDARTRLTDRAWDHVVTHAA